MRAPSGKRDHGLFGPESVTWRVHVEPILWVGGIRALLLQSLHPRVMRGTAQNSDLLDPARAWERFQRTAEFVGTRTFGTTAEVERAGRRIRRMHAPLRGHDPDTDTEFAIDDVDNLLWVHCGEIDSYVDVAQRSGILTAAEADRYVAESRRAAEVVGIPAEAAPASRAELDEYFDRVRPQLYACREAREGLLRSLNPPVPRELRLVRLVAPPVTTLAFTLLPRWARRMYGAPGVPTTDLAATATLRALHAVTTALPDPPSPPEVDAARRAIRSRQRDGAPQTARDRVVEQ
ncbi:MAG: DUF2236 domain-containing protein [Pseudonocardiaceae bacterium]|nr:DUF2236 domain-containing protein [Pseudonocardiaceae bacterium]